MSLNAYIPARGLRILVAEDDEWDRFIANRILASEGYTVVQTTDGEAAWEELNRNHFDLLIANHDMPRLAWLTLIERIRKAGMKLPVILAFDPLNNATLQNHPRLNIKAMIPKPFNLREFAATVRNVLRTSVEDAADAKGISANPPQAYSTMQARTGPPIHNHVLIVEDDAVVRSSLAAVLQSEGYEVDEASNGIDAVTRASRHKPDLVLLDVNMPVKNGWDTFHKLTTEHPRVPIIIVTARPDRLFTSLGASALLEKPLDIPMLLRTMAKQLGQSAGQKLARLAGSETGFHSKAATTPGKYSRATVTVKG